MFKILQKTVSTGIVTVNYPAEPAKISERFRDRLSMPLDPCLNIIDSCGE